MTLQGCYRNICIYHNNLMIRFGCWPFIWQFEFSSISIPNMTHLVRHNLFMLWSLVKYFGYNIRTFSSQIDCRFCCWSVNPNITEKTKEETCEFMYKLAPKIWIKSYKTSNIIQNFYFYEIVHLLFSCLVFKKG